MTQTSQSEALGAEEDDRVVQEVQPDVDLAEHVTGDVAEDVGAHDEGDGDEPEDDLGLGHHVQTRSLQAAVDNVLRLRLIVFFYHKCILQNNKLEEVVRIIE